MHDKGGSKPTTKPQKDAVKKTGQGHTMGGGAQKFTPQGYHQPSQRAIDPCSNEGYRPNEKQG